MQTDIHSVRAPLPRSAGSRLAQLRSEFAEDHVEGEAGTELSHRAGERQAGAVQQPLLRRRLVSVRGCRACNEPTLSRHISDVLQ
eukprot:1187545-Prorocentrum_minimum.AAC.12